MNVSKMFDDKLIDELTKKIEETEDLYSKELLNELLYRYSRLSNKYNDSVVSNCIKNNR